MRKKGLTLIEMVVVITLLSMMLGIILSAFFSMQRTNSIQTERLLLDNAVVSFSNLMEKEVRMLGYSPVNNIRFGIINGDNSSITYKYDENGDGTPIGDNLRGFSLSNDTIYYMEGAQISPVLFNVDSFNIQYIDMSGNVIPSDSLPVQEVDATGNTIQGHVVQSIKYTVFAEKTYGRDTIRVQHSAEIGLKNR